MWLEFAMTFLIGAILLYLPGGLLIKAFTAPGTIAVTSAPVISVLLYCLLSLAYPAIGVNASVVTIAVLPTVLCAGALAVSILVRRARFSRAPLHSTGSRHVESPEFHNCTPSWKHVFLYIAVGIAISLYVYVKCFDGADSIVQTYDNVFHYGLVESLAGSTDWSPLTATLYYGEDATYNPLPGTGYYPCAWHIVCALLVQAANVSTPIAANATNTLITALVFPLATLSMLSSIFKRDHLALAMGAIVTLAFAAFPWNLLEYWPLYPNTMSLALLPAIIGCFIRLCTRGATRSGRILSLLLFICGVVVIAFAQPNSVFSAMVFLIAFCVWRIYGEARRHFEGSPHRNLLALGIAAIAAIAAIALWAIFYVTPFLQAVIGYYWAPTEPSAAHAFAGIVTLAFNNMQPQYILAILLAVGFVATLVKHRHLIWLNCSYVLACAIMFVASTAEDVPLKHFLAGFWYTDPYRVAAFVVLCGIPLASLGLATISDALARACRKRAERGKPSRAIAPAIACIIAVAFALVNFLPNTSALQGGQTAFGFLRSNALALNNGTIMDPYDREEMEFVERVKEVVEDDDLIINQPYDGSMYAYSHDGLNLYYRYIAGYGYDKNETAESSIIRTELDELATNDDVAEAVEAVGADYVLVLSRDAESMMEFFAHSDVEQAGTGLNAIGDSTQGLEIVLEEDDMRLYRISSSEQYITVAETIEG